MSDLKVSTPRLELVASSVESLTAAQSAPALAALLNCRMVDSWPPSALKGALNDFIEMSKSIKDQGWMPWWWVLVEDGDRVLVGNGGFLGAPHECGFTEIGFEVQPEYRRKGIGKEAVSHLLKWAFQTPEVGFVEGNTETDNHAAIKLLTHLGFAPSEEEDGIVRMVVTRNDFNSPD